MDHTSLIEYGFYAGLGATWAVMVNYAVVWAGKRIVQHISWRRNVRKRQSK